MLTRPALRLSVVFVFLGWIVGLASQVVAQEFRALEVNPPQSTDGSYLLIHANIIDGRGGKPIRDGAIFVRNSKIVAIKDSDDDFAITEQTRVVDMEGQSILPGFVDCHFHSINDLGLLKEFLGKGVTSLRDPGHPFRFYQAVLQTSDPMPRVFLCGAHLDAYPPVWPRQAALVHTPKRAAEVVNQHADRGASAIKVYFRLPKDLIAATCKAADARGLPVTAHLELVSAADAIEAGIDSVEHVTSLGTTIMPEMEEDYVRAVAANPKAREMLRYRMWAKMDLAGNPRIASTIQLLVDNDITLVPTLAVAERRAEFDGVSEIEVAGFEKMSRFVGLCHQAGVKIAVGSHTWVPGAKFGLAFQREVELLVEAGMSPGEVLVAATLGGANHLGVEDRLGTLAAGLQADLVVVDGNPLEDIKDLRNVSRVMINGRWVR